MMGLSARPDHVAICVLLVVASLLGCEVPEPKPYTLPAEWGPHEAIWLSYYGEASDSVLDQLAASTDASLRLVVVAQGDSLARSIEARWRALGIAQDRAEFISAETDPRVPLPVVRDIGPIFLRRTDGGLAVLDQRWAAKPGEGASSDASKAHVAAADSFPVRMAQRLGLPIVRTPLMIEGGAIEVNGAGLLITTKYVMRHLNPEWSLDSMATELQRVFGAAEVIWLERGMANDQGLWEPRVYGNVFSAGTGGHTDEFCRFVNDSTVLLAWPDDAELHDSVQVITRQRMEENMGILQNVRWRGRSLRVEKVPTPDTESWTSVLDTNYRMSRKVVHQYPDLHHGDTIRGIPAASYLNYLVTNARVFVPACWHQGSSLAVKAKGERVWDIVERAFPDRTIVAIDPRAINDWGGGMHCWTQQQPRLKP